MTFGQRLDVKNLSNEFWTPKLEPQQSAMFMMATPGGEAVKLYPMKPGHYHLIDHDRAYAVNDLYAFLHPLHATSDLSGGYRIDGIPVGKLTVNTSHPKIRDTEASKTVEIKAGAVTRVDLTLSYTAPVKAPADAGATPSLR